MNIELLNAANEAHKAIGRARDAVREAERLASRLQTAARDTPAAILAGRAAAFALAAERVIQDADHAAALAVSRATDC
jgi:hypothetical protein